MFIMEQSLKEENCTMDDISVYLDDVTEVYFEKLAEVLEKTKSNIYNS